MRHVLESRVAARRAGVVMPDGHHRARRQCPPVTATQDPPPAATCNYYKTSSVPCENSVRHSKWYAGHTAHLKEHITTVNACIGYTHRVLGLCSGGTRRSGGVLPQKASLNTCRQRGQNIPIERNRTNAEIERISKPI